MRILPLAAITAMVRPFVMANTPVWSNVIELPVIAVAMANVEHRILMWSGGDGLRISGKPGNTNTTLWDPDFPNDSVLQVVDTTGHDMLCPGTSILPNGELMVTGGTSDARVSFYDPVRRLWTRGSDMKIGRGYHSNAVLSDGKVLVLGGSWFAYVGIDEYNYWFTPLLGWLFNFLRYKVFDWLFKWLFPPKRKDGELWDPLTDEWRVLENVKCEGSIVTEDDEGQYRDDNHMWLFQAPNGKVFHVGPSVMTHWITTEGSGSITDAALRGSNDAMNGNAIMYDIGQILVVGGAANYDAGPAFASAFVIELNEMDDTVDIQQVSDMNHPRTMLNSVVMPDGKVAVIGGAEEALLYDDSRAVLVAELWDPLTRTFTELPPMQVPRTYHSTAILMQDGRILVAGGGYCDCDADHFNAEILTPPYLFSNMQTGELAMRPEIENAPTFAVAGDVIDVEVSVPVVQFSLVRLSAVTHAVNTELRRIPLEIISSAANNVYSLRIPDNPSVSLAGTYFLFALDSNGVPSVATTISIAPPTA